MAHIKVPNLTRRAPGGEKSGKIRNRRAHVQSRHEHVRLWRWSGISDGTPEGPFWTTGWGLTRGSKKGGPDDRGMRSQESSTSIHGAAIRLASAAGSEALAGLLAAVRPSSRAALASQSGRPDLNQQPADLQSTALPIELRPEEDWRVATRASLLAEGRPQKARS